MIEKPKQPGSDLPLSMLSFLKGKPTVGMKQKNGFLILQQRRARERRQKAKADLMERRARLK